MRAVIAILFAALQVASSANVYIRAGASGAADGSNWTDAFTNAPSAMTRGNTYYFADGAYPDDLYDDALSGTTLITIKKASTSDHGTETGWSSTYGDGQAVFTGKMKFRKGFYVFDGSYRDESNPPYSWTNTSAYGFVVRSNTTGQQIKIGGITSGGSDDVGGEAHANNVTVQYVFIDGAVLPTAAVRMYAIDTESSGTASNVVVSKCAVRNSNNHYFIRDTYGALVEYSASWDALNNGNNHGEIFNLYYSADAAICRYNYTFNNFQPGGFSGTYYSGTALAAIVVSADCQFYGNLSVDDCFTDAGIGWDGTNPANSVTGLRFHHNTFAGSRSYGPHAARLETGSTGCTSSNNLFVGVSYAHSAVTHDYNAYSGAGDSESNDQTGLTTSIFVSSSDWRLATDTAPGSESFTDMLGNTGTSRGAFQAGAANPNTPRVHGGLRNLRGF